MSKTTKIFTEIFLTLLSAIISALTLHVFVYNNKFAPSGVDGIATMLQETTEINAGIYYFVLNSNILYITTQILL